MMIGLARPAHIVSPSVTVRGLVNMTAIAAVDAQTFARGDMSSAPLRRAD